MTAERVTSERRVVVTGLGLVTPLGRTPTDIWDRWAEGRSVAGPITRFDPRTLPIRIACEVPHFDPRKEVRNRKLLRLMIAGEDFGFRAATDAITQAGVEAGIDSGAFDSLRCGLSIACHKEGFRHQNLHSAFQVAQRDDGSIDWEKFVSDGWSCIPPQIIIEALPNVGLFYIAHEFCLQGVNYNQQSIGTGGLLSLSEAMHAVASDEADVMVAGSFDTWVNWMCLGYNHYNGLLSPSAEPPETVARPFDVRRTGSVAGEGAGFFVLEELSHARNRGVPIFGELLGASSSNGVPGDSEEAAVESLAHCITAALDSAECAPEEIDLIQLHGDATLRGDRIEARAIHVAFGDLATKIPATTVKSAMGLMGVASGPVEVALALESLRRGEVLPIVNLQQPDPDCHLNFVQTPLAGLNLRRALVIQRGWPNLNAALVVGRMTADLLPG